MGLRRPTESIGRGASIPFAPGVLVCLPSEFLYSFSLLPCCLLHLSFIVNVILVVVVVENHTLCRIEFKRSNVNVDLVKYCTYRSAVLSIFPQLHS